MARNKAGNIVKDSLMGRLKAHGRKGQKLVLTESTCGPSWFLKGMDGNESSSW